MVPHHSQKAQRKWRMSGNSYQSYIMQNQRVSNNVSIPVKAKVQPLATNKTEDLRLLSNKQEYLHVASLKE